MMHQIIKHKTDNNEFEIHVLTKIIPLKDVPYNYKHCEKLCKEGCKNYGNKWSCPPSSDEIDYYIDEGFKYMVVNIFKIFTKTYAKKYNTLRMINVINKSLQRKLFDRIALSNKDSVKLENGSCRLCKVCNKVKFLHCKYPKKMRYSLEATGVLVSDLVEKLFGFPLLWYKKGNIDHFPEYGCTVGGILTNKPKLIKEEIQNVISEMFTEYKRG